MVPERRMTPKCIPFYLLVARTRKASHSRKSTSKDLYEPLRDRVYEITKLLILAPSNLVNLAKLQEMTTKFSI